MNSDKNDFDAFAQMIQATQAKQESSFQVTLDRVVEVQNDPCIQLLKEYIAQTQNTYITYSHT